MLKKYWHKNKKNLWIGLKILIGILAIGKIAFLLNAPFIIGPLAASCGLVFTVPNAPAARVRNIMCGHIIAAILGIILFYFFGGSLIVIAIAGALSVILMELTKGVHPPACATAVIAVISQANVLFAMDIFIGALALIFIGALLNNMHVIKQYLKNKYCQ